MLSRQSSIVCAVVSLVCVCSWAAEPVSPSAQAWELLQTGVKDERTGARVIAVRTLSLLPGRPSAIQMAQQALSDDKPEVREAGAFSLGELHATSAVPALQHALDDKDPAVVIAAARSLVLLHDPRGYAVYYEVFTGQRHGKGMVGKELATLTDKKKLAEMGLQRGIGFIPFGSLGYGALRAFMKDESSPVRAAAATMLIQDPDPETERALTDAAVGDKSQAVRMAALEAIARRGKPQLAAKIAPAMSDEHDEVKYTAAAVILRLTDIASKQRKRRK